MLLVGLQYVLSIGMLCATIVISQQFEFLNSKDQGFHMDQLVSFSVPQRLIRSEEVLQKELGERSGILGLAPSFGVPGGIVAGDGVYLGNDKETYYGTHIIMADQNYLPTFKIDLVAGRNFTDTEHDKANTFIINEQAVTYLGFNSAEEALENEIQWQKWDDESQFKKGKIIGVVKDFHIKSLKHKIEPVVITMEPRFYSYLTVRIDGNQTKTALLEIEDWWKSSGVEMPIRYEFLSQTFAKEYEKESKLNFLFKILTLIGIVLSVIGVMAMISFHVNIRLKELSIRQVLGAKRSSLIGLLAKPYLIIILISYVVAVPLTVYILNNWLDNYAYHITISVVLYFVLAFILLIETLLPVVSISFQALNKNLVEHLKS